MIYDLLREYKNYLLEAYSRETADTFRARLAALFAGQPAQDTVNRLDVQKVLDKLSEVKYKNYFSQAKNAFLHFCEFQHIKLSVDTMDRIKELESSTKKKHRKLKSIAYTKIENKIKRLRNMKLKLSYQTIIATGLRVSELSWLSPNDCTISADSITFNFIGKGGKAGTATIKAVEYPKLFERLKVLIHSTLALPLATPAGKTNNMVNSDKKVFYSAGYLQSKARELGFGCHDLRRAFAKLEYKKCRNKAEVSRKMRHSNIRTTNIYLKSKVKL